MLIQVNTDRNIESHDGLTAHVNAVVEHALSRFGAQVTRVEVHLSDQNGNKPGEDDKRCVMEARLTGRPPSAVTHDAASVHQAIDGAATKLRRVLDSTLAKLHDQR